MGVTLEATLEGIGTSVQQGFGLRVLVAPEQTGMDREGLVGSIVARIPEEYRAAAKSRLIEAPHEKLETLRRGLEAGNGKAQAALVKAAAGWHTEDVARVHQEAEDAVRTPTMPKGTIVTIEELVGRGSPLYAAETLNRDGSHAKLVAAGEAIEPHNLLQTGSRIYLIEEREGALFVKPYEARRTEGPNDKFPLRPFMDTVDTVEPLLRAFLEGRSTQSYSLARELFKSVYESLSTVVDEHFDKTGTPRIVGKPRINEGTFRARLENWAMLLKEIDKGFGATVDEESQAFTADNTVKNGLLGREQVVESYSKRFAPVRDSLFEMAVQYLLQKKEYGDALKEIEYLADKQSNLLAALIPRNEKLLHPLKMGSPVKPYGPDISYAVIHRRLVVVGKWSERYASTEDVSKGGLAYWMLQDHKRHEAVRAEFGSLDGFLGYLANTSVQELYENKMFDGYFVESGRGRKGKRHHPPAQYAAIVKSINVFRSSHKRADPDASRVLFHFAKALEALGVVEDVTQNDYEGALVGFELQVRGGILASRLGDDVCKNVQQNYEKSAVDLALQIRDELLKKQQDCYIPIQGRATTALELNGHPFSSHPNL